MFFVVLIDLVNCDYYDFHDYYDDDDDDVNENENENALLNVFVFFPASL